MALQFPITSPQLPPIPPPEMPVLRPNGTFTTEWYSYLKGVETLLRIVLAQVP